MNLLRSYLLFVITAFGALSASADIPVDSETNATTNTKTNTNTNTNTNTTQLAEALSRVGHMSASFKQQTVDRTQRLMLENTGKLWVNPGAKFRIETNAPAEQTLVSNGQDIWVYDADLEQVIISKLEADLSQVPVLLLGGNLATLDASYAVSVYDDEMGKNYVLSPLSSESLFTSLSISFQQSLPVRIAILDALGQQTLIRLTDVRINDTAEPAIFDFVPPAGTDVIDDRF